MPFPHSQTFPRTKSHSGPLLTVANLDRMAPPKPKNPYRIQIWAYEVSIACYECPVQTAVIEAPTWWKKVLRRNSSHSGLNIPSSSTSTTLPKLNLNLNLNSKPSSTTLNKLEDLALGIPSPPNKHSLSLSQSHSHEPQSTAMYAPFKSEPELQHGTGWGCEDFEPDNGESSLDIASSSSGVGWGARDRAQRLDRAQHLLDTDTKKWKAAAMKRKIGEIIT